jgi:hypothetical protein
MKELATALQEFVKQRKGGGLIFARVIAKNGFLIDCEDGAGNQYLDVRIHAAPVRQGQIAIPHVGARVIITDLTDSGQEYVAVLFGQLERWILNVASKTEVEVDDEVIRLGGGKVEPAVLGDSLNVNLDDLLSHLNTLIVALETFTSAQIGVTASGPLLPLNPAYTALAPSLAAVKLSLTAVQTALDNHLSDVVKITP